MISPQTLAQLRDVHSPVAVQNAAVDYVYWPLLLMAIVTVLGGWLAVSRTRLWRRQARDELALIKHLLARNEIDAGWQKMADLLRRLALLDDWQMAAKQRPAKVSSSALLPSIALHDEAWLLRLDQLFDCHDFSGPMGRALLTQPYRRTADAANLPALIALVESGLKRFGARRIRTADQPHAGALDD